MGERIGKSKIRKLKKANISIIEAPVMSNKDVIFLRNIVCLLELSLQG